MMGDDGIYQRADYYHYDLVFGHEPIESGQINYTNALDERLSLNWPTDIWSNGQIVEQEAGKMSCYFQYIC